MLAVSLLFLCAAHGDTDRMLDALDIPSGERLQAQVRGPAAAHGVRGNIGVVKPTAGADFVVLSTGTIGSMTQPGKDLTPSGEDGDSVVLSLQLLPPPGAQTLLFDFFFLSAEYPEFVGSSYNDIFSAEVSGSAWSGEAAKDAQGNPVSVNNVFFDVTRPLQLMGTGFGFGVGGGTGWLTATIPVASQQPVTLKLNIYDVSDGIFDSMVLLDNVRWSTSMTEEAGLLRAEGGGDALNAILDTGNLPVTCQAGQPCTGRVSTDRNGQIVITAGAQNVGGGRSEAVLNVTPSAPGELPITVRLLGEDGSVIAEQIHVVTVMEALELVLPDVIDFGQIDAGTPTLDPGSCQVLDLTGSRGLSAYTFHIASNRPPGCQADPALRFVTRSGRAVALELPLAGYALDSTSTLCLAVPYCTGESVQNATLTITPVGGAAAEPAGTVTLRWEVTGRSWLACNAGWLLVVGGVLVGIWVVMGFIRPHRFSKTISITIAGSQKGLRRTSPQRLRECTGSRAGFYTDACLGVHADGSINGRARGALLQLQAGPRGEIRIRGPVTVMDRRTRQLETPDDLEQGHIPTEGATYCVGDLWFRFESC